MRWPPYNVERYTNVDQASLHKEQFLNKKVLYTTRTLLDISSTRLFVVGVIAKGLVCLLAD